MGRGAAGIATHAHVRLAVTGDYFEARRPATTTALAQDRAAAERLWSVSADLCGIAP